MASAASTIRRTSWCWRSVSPFELGKTVVPVLVDDAATPRPRTWSRRSSAGCPGAMRNASACVSYRTGRSNRSRPDRRRQPQVYRPVRARGGFRTGIRRYPEHVRAEELSAAETDRGAECRLSPRFECSGPPPPPRAARPPAGVRDINELEVAIWTSGAVPVLLEVRATSDRESATDLSEVAEKDAGRLKVARFAADRSIGLDVVTKLDVTTFPTLLLFHDGVEVRRADDQDARAALLQDLERLLG